jgi:hypothetical protein
MKTALTIHANKRLQQRGIPMDIVDLLEQFGSASRCGGAERIFFDKRARHRLKNYFGRDRSTLASIERWLNTYAVIGDNGRIVTVGHRKRRFHRH